MSVAALREELQRELTVWALVEFRVPKEWERWDTAEPLLAVHLPRGTRVRMPLRLLPDWYRALWWDPTQIDGYAEVVAADREWIRLIGAQPGYSDLGRAYTVSTKDFLDAVLACTVGDAS